MSQDLHVLWKTVLGEIETEVSRANFLTLFRKTSLLSIDENVATIAGHSAIAIDLLQKRFGGIIKQTLDKHTGTNISVAFTAKTTSDMTKAVSGPLFASQEEKPTMAYQTLPRHLSRVRAEFRFETMAVSSSNQLAFVSAQTVAKNLGTSYNPLFIYGPVGVGKTHLMQAVANEVHEKNSDKKTIYTTSEEFTNEVVEAIRSNDTARMKRRFRTADLLIIDDVQFVAGKDRVQEELFHTFNILIDKNAQVVLSSDRPPSEIKKLEKRLSSRFSAGLTVDIESPDFELRTAILLIKAKKYGVDLSIDTAKTIAQDIHDARELEGALLRIITEAKTKNVEITEGLATIVLGKKQPPSNHFHPDDVIKGVCLFYGFKLTQVKGPKRSARLVLARQIAMYLLKRDISLTLVEIGNVLGGRDHTTVMHGIEKIDGILNSSEKNGAKRVSEDIVGISSLLSSQHVG